MPTIRTLSSLAQLLALFPRQLVVVLLSKYGLRITIEQDEELFDIRNALRNQADSPACMAILEEVVRTNGDLSNQVKPRYRFAERYDDLKRCLVLEGYVVAGRDIAPLDPSIADTAPVEDDLVRAVKASDLGVADEIVQKLNDSADSFRRTTPDYNACLTNARVALETTARAVAHTRFRTDPLEYDPLKWGSIISHLKTKGFISQEEERGLAGVYTFLSPGAHRPMGLTEEEACRLGRSLALNMCWYLVKRHQSEGRE